MRIFITGATTGLGEIAGNMLMKAGHEVVFHARNSKSKMQENITYVVGDLSKIEEIKSVAKQVNALGKFDCIIHNAGVYNASAEEIFNVNVLAPFILSTEIHQTKRMVYLSSGMHLGGRFNLERIKNLSYSDSKLYVLMIAKYLARNLNECFINAVDPGWVPTRMGGASAPDDLNMGAETQVWLATSNDKSALVTGKYFHHKKVSESNPAADSIELQDDLIKYLKSVAIK